jgi:hypothetical protein
MTTAAIDRPASTADADPGTLSIGGLTAEAAAVLWDTERWALPRPCMVTVHDSPPLSFQFGDRPASFAALAQWAEAFGAVITSKTICRENGSLARLCRVSFGYHGVRAQAYAIATTTPVST